MSEYVTLMGAESVQSAGNTIQRAADNMQQAANLIDDALQRHERFLDDWLGRLQEVLEAQAKKGGA